MNTAREALQAAHEALTRHQNVTATDRPGAYEEALRDGCDHAGARDLQREIEYQLDESDVLKQIAAALEGQGD